MYCVIQEIELKKKNEYGEYKELEVYKNTWVIDGAEGESYSYRYTGGRFERPIRKAYKISVHHSYRKDGKVKKKQWILGTLEYYYIANDGLYIGDCCNMEEKAAAIGITQDELFRIISVKIDSLTMQIKKEYQKTEEFKTHQEHKKIINKYLKDKRAFEEIYGANTYDYYYDVFGVLREEEKFEAFKRQYEAAQDQRRSYYEKFKSNYSNFDFSSYSNTKPSNYTYKEKEYLKKIYRSAAKALHPDITGDNEGMKFLNKLKEQWNI